MLLTLDDAHLADSATLAALRGLARLGLPAGVVLLVAAREPDAQAHPIWSGTHADLALLDGVSDVRLSELDAAAVRRLVVRHLPGLAPDGAARVAEALWERTRGHALHVSAVIESLSGLDQPDGEKACDELATVIPSRLRPLLDHQLAGLDPAARDALEGLAVLAPLSLADLGRLLDVAPRTLSAQLRTAVDRGLLAGTGDGFAFRHALTRDAVLDAVPPASAQTLHHARYRVLVGDERPEPFTLLRHAVGAGPLVSTLALGDARLGAGIAAYRQGALEEALVQLDAVLEASRPSAVALHRGLVLEALGRHDEADEVLDDVVEHAATTAEQGLAATDGREIDDAVVAAVGHDAMGISVAGRPRRARRLRRTRSLPLSKRQRAEVLRSLILEEEQLHGDVDDPTALPELLALAAHGFDDPRLLAGVRVLEANHLVDASVPAAQRLAVSSRLRAGRAAEGGRPAFEAEELRIAALLAAGRQDEALAAHRGARTARGRPAPAADRCGWSPCSTPASLWRAARPTRPTRPRSRRCTRGPGARAPRRCRRLRGAPAGAPPGSAARCPRSTACPPARPSHVPARRGVVGGRGRGRRAVAGDLDAAAGHLAEWHRKREGREGRLFDRPGLCLAAARGSRWATSRRREACAAACRPTRRRGRRGHRLGDVRAGDALPGPRRRRCSGAHGGPRLFATAASLADGLGWAPWADAARGLARLARTGPERGGAPGGTVSPDPRRTPVRSGLLPLP